MEIIGWIIWVIGCLLFLIQLVLSAHKDTGVKILARSVALLVFLGLIMTLYWNISKLHLVWWIPFSFILPLLYFKWNVNRKIAKDAAKINMLDVSLFPKLPKIETDMTLEQKQSFIRLLAVVPQIKEIRKEIDFIIIAKYAEMLDLDYNDPPEITDEEDTVERCLETLKNIGWIEKRLLIRCLADLVYLDNPHNTEASDYLVAVARKLGLSLDEFKSIIEEEFENYSRNLSTTRRNT